MSGSYTHMAGHGSLSQLVWLSSGRVEGSQRCSSTIPVVFSTQWTICLRTPGIPGGERRDFEIRHTNMTPSCFSVRVIYVQYLEGTWWATDRHLVSHWQTRSEPLTGGCEAKNNLEMTEWLMAVKHLKVVASSLWGFAAFLCLFLFLIPWVLDGLLDKSRSLKMSLLETAVRIFHKWTNGVVSEGEVNIEWPTACSKAVRYISDI